MFKSFAQFFQALTALFSAFTRGCNSLDILAETAEDQASAFRDSRKLEIRAQRAELEAKLAKTPKPTKSSKDFEL